MTTETLTRPATERAFSLSEACQFWLDTVTEAMNREGITPIVSPFMDGWRDYMQNRPDRAGLMPVLNPDIHGEPVSMKSFYLDLQRDGETLAVIGCRDIGDVDLDDWQTDGKTWGQDGRLPARPVPAHMKRGRYIYRGGLFVPPEHRMDGLARLATSYMRALILKNFTGFSAIISHCTASTFNKLLPFRAYGYLRGYPEFEANTCFASVDGQALYLLEAPFDFLAEKQIAEAGALRVNKTNDYVGVLRVLRGDTAKAA